jgi:hypothetical protein
MSNSPNLSSPSIRGLAYPLSIANGNLAVKTDFDIKAQEIRSVLETRFFERVMRADYGVADHTLDIINPGQINSEFQTSIMQEVQGLSYLNVSGDWITQGDDGVYKVSITYAIEGVPQPPINFALAS